MSKDMKKFQIVYRDPKDLTPYINNSKVHTDEQIDTLAGMIAQYGFDQPIVIDKAGVIIKGHGRREAALRLGLDQVPVIQADHLDEHQIMASRIADNKIASLDYDVEKLRFDIGTLERSGFELGLLGVGFDDLKELLKGDTISSINRGDESSEWVDMPEFTPGEGYIKLIFHFKTDADREKYVADNNITVTMKKSDQWIVHQQD